MKTMTYCVDNNSSTVLIVDEADVDVTQAFIMPEVASEHEHIRPIHVIFRMSHLPLVFLRLPSLHRWYTARASKLKAYAENENMRHAHKDVHFVFACGTTRKVIEQTLGAGPPRSSGHQLLEQSAKQRVYSSLQG